MSRDTDVSVKVDIDVFDAFRSLEALQDKADKLGVSVVKLRKQADREFLAVTRRGQRVISGMRMVISGIGASLDPAFDAFLTTISTALETVLVTHRVLEAGTGGLAATFTIGLSMIATAVAVTNLTQIALLKDQTMEQMNRSLSLISGLESIFT